MEPRFGLPLIFWSFKFWWAPTMRLISPWLWASSKPFLVLLEFSKKKTNYIQHIFRIEWNKLYFFAAGGSLKKLTENFNLRYFVTNVWDIKTKFVFITIYHIYFLTLLFKSYSSLEIRIGSRAALCRHEFKSTSNTTNQSHRKGPEESKRTRATLAARLS